jgi:hypothetical protein
MIRSQENSHGSHRMLAHLLGIPYSDSPKSTILRAFLFPSLKEFCEMFIASSQTRLPNCNRAYDSEPAIEIFSFEDENAVDAPFQPTGNCCF